MSFHHANHQFFYDFRIIVHATDDSIDNKERLIPFIRNNFISQIDKEKKIITVNWQSDY